MERSALHRKLKTLGLNGDDCSRRRRARMKVVVGGAGQVGFNIARYLASTGNDVTIIDQRGELAQRIGDSLDIQAIVGHASHPGMLEQAGAEDADMLIAVTQSDEVNMVACQVAHTPVQGADQDRPHPPAGLSAEPLAGPLPAASTADRHRDLAGASRSAHAIALRLEVPGALNAVPFAEGRVRLVGLRCQRGLPDPGDTPLRQLTYLFPDLHIVIVGINRDDQFFIPDADDQILAAGRGAYSSSRPRISPGHCRPSARRSAKRAGGHRRRRQYRPVTGAGARGAPAGDRRSR